MKIRLFKTNWRRCSPSEVLGIDASSYKYRPIEIACEASQWDVEMQIAQTQMNKQTKDAWAQFN